MFARIVPVVWLFIVSVALVPAASRADALHDVLARAKAASGGAALDELRGLASEGALTAGGMAGTINTTIDVRTGRFVARYDLGPVTGAEGHDGERRWTQGAGGEVQRQESAGGLASAANGRWLATFSYFYPDRHAGTLRYVGEQAEQGARYHVVDATPSGGRALKLWFDAESGLLTRIVDVDGGTTTTSTLSDYRDIGGGVRIAFAQRDSTGDPKYDTIQQAKSITRDPSFDDATFAAPEKTLADFAIDGDAPVVVLPFELLNNHIYVNAQLNGKPMRMLVDTGGANIITPATAKALGVKSEGSLEGRGVGEESTSVGLAKLDGLTLGGARFAKPVFYTFDLGFLDEVEGHPLDGIVGFEVFRRFVVEIVYEKRELRLHDPKRYTPDPQLVWVPITFDETTPLIAATLDGVEGEFTLDTGSRASLTLHAPFAKRNDSVKRHGAAVERINGWGVGGPARTRVAMMDGLVLAGHKVPTFTGDIFTGTKGAFAQDNVVGNIGGGVLRRFTVTFDYANRRVAFVPNGDFAMVDAPDRSGLWINRDRDAFVVVECVAASPCAKAGLKAKDRLVAVDGHPAATFALGDARQILRGAAGAKVIVRRDSDGKAENITLTLADPFAQ